MMVKMIYGDDDIDVGNDDAGNDGMMLVASFGRKIVVPNCLILHVNFIK